MMDSNTLLSQYARTGSESAFRELVSRYIDLVYSTAFRLVDGDVESAQDVAQTVFVALADQAKTLPKDVMLGGWLHLRTRFAAGKLMRTERRRQLRERQAAEMNAIQDHSESNLAQFAPVLDEAIGQLDAEDRTAILLRFFERKDFRGVGDALGSSEDAARKRVDRALEKLHVLLKHRGATLSAAALGTALATEAVTGAPAGLAATISSAAILAGTTITSTVTATKAIAMTTLQKTLVTATVAILAGAGIYEARQAAQLHNQVQTLQQQQAPLGEQIQILSRAFEDATNQLAALRQDNERLNRNSADLLRLRSEVGALHQQTNELAKLREKKAELRQTSPEEAQTEPQIMELVRAKDLYVRAWLQAFLAYAHEHQGQCPESFQQATSYLPESIKAISATADQFEIVYRGSLDAIKDQDIIVLREKTLWQYIGGKWGRMYGMADGRAQYCSSSDKTATGSFDDYEKQHIIPLAGQ